MKPVVTVLDYGSGNLLSIVRAIAESGGQCRLTSDLQSVARAGHLVIPGVGAFGNCVAAVREFGMETSIRQCVDSGGAVLGICVGMQMLLDVGEEFGLHRGLGLIPGVVSAIPNIDLNGVRNKVPHTGWSPLYPVAKDWSGTILSSVKPGHLCYFVHSFQAIPDREEHRLAETHYNNMRICAAIRSGRVFGCQFHPEKSGQVGLAILKRFIAM